MRLYKILGSPEAVLKSGALFVMLSSWLILHGAVEDTIATSDHGMQNIKDRISCTIQRYTSQYALGPTEYVFRKLEQDTVFIFASRLDKLKAVMREIVEAKLHQEVIRITSFFSDKMRPFGELEEMRRGELLTALQNYINSFPNSPLTPYAILRYAELLYENISYDYIARYEKAVLEGRPVPVKDYTPVIKIYEDFLKKYPNFPRRDAVLYLAGYVLEEMGESLDAVERYFEPLARMRISQFAPEAAMRSAEFWFNAGDLDKAEEFYMIVLDFPKHPLYPKALFKLGWTYYRKGEYDLAIEYFSEAIDAGGEEERKGGILQESVDYLIASVVEFGGFSKVKRDLQDRVISSVQRVYGINQNEAMQVIFETEGKTYFDQGKYQEAIESYRTVVERFYSNPRSIISAFGIYESLKKLGRIEDASNWIIRVARDWGANSQWAKLNPEEYNKNEKKIESHLLEVAKFFHSRGELEKAETSYALFLELFPKSEFSGEVQFLLAELYFARGDYIRAYKYYKANIENTYVRHNKYLLDAAWSAVISADKAMQTGAKEAPELLKEASFLFERLFPMDRRVPIALYKAAQVLGKEGRTADALLILEKIVERYPGSEVVGDSILEIIKIYLDMGDLERVYTFSISARKRRDILKEDDINYLNDVGAKALFKIARVLERNKNYKEAVSRYLELMNLFPKSDLLDDSLYNVIMIKHEEKSYNDVITLSKIFMDSFPKSEFLFDVVYARAIALANLFYFEEAISTYREIISRLEMKRRDGKLSDADRDVFRSSLRTLINIYTGLGKFEEAALWVIRYYQEFGQEESNPEQLIMSAAELYHNSGNIRKTLELLDDYINRRRQKTRRKYTSDIILALHRMAKIYRTEAEKAREKSVLMKKYEEIISEIIRGIKEVPDREGLTEAYSEALFYFAQRNFEEYRKIRLEKRDTRKQMAEKLKRKTEMMKKVQSEMAEIARLGDPYWSFAALYYIGESYREFANMLLEAPIPPEIESIKDPEEREMAIAVYKEELEKQAFPFEDSAIKYFSSAVEKIKELGVRNDWTSAIFRGLKSLDPLAPVEIEDDRTADSEMRLSMRADDIPAIRERTDETTFASHRKEPDIETLTDLHNLKEYISGLVIRNIFSPAFLYYHEDQLRAVRIDLTTEKRN